MNINRRGLAPVIMILLIAAGIVVLGGVFYYFHMQAPSVPAPVSTAPASSTPPVIATTTTPTSTGISTSTSTGFSLSPSSGLVGTMVTIHGSGFAATGNTVTFGGLVGPSMKDISSPDGKMLTFTVPSTLGPNCKPTEPCPQFIMVITPPHTYSVSVISGDITQNVGTFTVLSRAGSAPTQ